MVGVLTGWFYLGFFLGGSLVCLEREGVARFWQNYNYKSMQIISFFKGFSSFFSCILKLTVIQGPCYTVKCNRFRFVVLLTLLKNARK